MPHPKHRRWLRCIKKSPVQSRSSPKQSCIKQLEPLTCTMAASTQQLARSESASDLHAKDVTKPGLWRQRKKEIRHTEEAAGAPGEVSTAICCRPPYGAQQRQCGRAHIPPVSTVYAGLCVLQSFGTPGSTVAPASVRRSDGS